VLIGMMRMEGTSRGMELRVVSLRIVHFQSLEKADTATGGG
jgi:hypothetical protein